MLISIETYLGLLNRVELSATNCSSSTDLENIKYDVSCTLRDLEEEEAKYLQNNCEILDFIKSRLSQLQIDLSNRLENICV